MYRILAVLTFGICLVMLFWQKQNKLTMLEVKRFKKQFNCFYVRMCLFSRFWSSWAIIK